jgi:acyl-CoA-dependent ceramide synthase
LFICVWIYLRHYLNLRILWATLTEFRTVGPFELNWETQQYKCWISQYITFSLLALLQAVNLFWLFLILRIAKNYAFNNVVQDERSEDEEDEDEDTSEGQHSEKTISDKKTNGIKPVVLVNGEPVEAQSKTAGVRERKRKG